MTEENFSPQESLQLIQSMIEKTKENISGNSLYFLFWGRLVFAACTVHFLLKHIWNYDKHYCVLWVILPGILLSVYFGIWNGSKKKVKTYTDESMGYLWTGMGISLFVLSFMVSNTNPEGMGIFPFFVMLYGLGTFVSGFFLGFRSFLAVGILVWAIAIAAVFLSYDYQLMAGATAILVSYIIPGHLLKMQNQPG